MTATQIKRRRYEILVDTAKFYNTSKLAINPDGLGRYYIQDNPREEPKMCAIGRLVPKLAYNIPNGAVNCDYIFKRLPKKIQVLGEDFLMNIQCFHDAKPNWTESGLSKRGMHAFYQIKKRFCE